MARGDVAPLTAVTAQVVELNAALRLGAAMCGAKRISFQCPRLIACICPESQASQRPRTVIARGAS
jgi:hypothetical protein